MHGLGSVYGQPDKYGVLFEKLRPIFIEQSPIGLHGVLDDLGWTCVLIDQTNGLLVEVKSHERGFPALPGN